MAGSGMIFSCLGGRLSLADRSAVVVITAADSGNTAIEHSPPSDTGSSFLASCVVGSPWLLSQGPGGFHRHPWRNWTWGSFCPWTAALKSVRGAPVHATPMFGFRPSLSSVCNVQELCATGVPPELLPHHPGGRLFGLLLNIKSPSTTPDFLIYNLCCA